MCDRDMTRGGGGTAAHSPPTSEKNEGRPKRHLAVVADRGSASSSSSSKITRRKRRRSFLRRGEAALVLVVLALCVAAAVALAGGAKFESFFWVDLGILVKVLCREVPALLLSPVSVFAGPSSSPLLRSRAGDELGEARRNAGEASRPSSSSAKSHQYRSQDNQIPPADAQRQPLKVIGAGFARTGTSSLKEAMTMLGLAPYHMRDNLARDHGDAWVEYLEARREEATRAQAQEDDGLVTGSVEEDKRTTERSGAALSELVSVMSEGGYNATLDFPACLAYEDLASVYPDALVVLSVRSSGQAWAASLSRTIVSIVNSMMPPWPWMMFKGVRVFVKLHDLIWDELGVSSSQRGQELASATPSPALKMRASLRRDALAAAHDRRIEEVRAAVPPERLLVHEPRDGWDPLCDFLSKASGSDNDEIRVRCDRIREEGVPYPHVNEDFGMQCFILTLKASALLFYAGVLLAVKWVVDRVLWQKGVPPPRGRRDHLADKEHAK